MWRASYQKGGLQIWDVPHRKRDPELNSDDFRGLVSHASKCVEPYSNYLGEPKQIPYNFGTHALSLTKPACWSLHSGSPCVPLWHNSTIDDWCVVWEGRKEAFMDPTVEGGRVWREVSFDWFKLALVVATPITRHWFRKGSREDIKSIWWKEGGCWQIVHVAVEAPQVNVHKGSATGLSELKINEILH